jgi:predicted TIM-barrel fold metal-dependent hydrolase
VVRSIAHVAGQPAAPESRDQPLLIVDCDIHEVVKSHQDLFPYLPKVYREQIEDFGLSFGSVVYPSIAKRATRHDLWQDDQTVPGTDVRQVREDHLDAYGIDYAILTGASVYGAAALPDADFAAALCRAFNDWELETWIATDERFRGSIHVAPQDPVLAVEEIERLGEHPKMVQVMLPAGARAPYGNRQYHPIWAAAERHGLVVCVHPSAEGAGINGPPTAAGHLTYYPEMRCAWAQIAQAHLASLIYEGVFAKFPRLKFLFIEHDTFWVPGMLWRMDADWKGLRFRVPWVERKPSEYVRSNVRFGSQPLPEPPDPRALLTHLEWMHAGETMVYASDFPHWDMDLPTKVLQGVPEPLKRRIFGQTAVELYGLPTE